MDINIKKEPKCEAGKVGRGGGGGRREVRRAEFAKPRWPVALLRPGMWEWGLLG